MPGQPFFQHELKYTGINANVSASHAQQWPQHPKCDYVASASEHLQCLSEPQCGNEESLPWVAELSCQRSCDSREFSLMRNAKGARIFNFERPIRGAEGKHHGPDLGGENAGTRMVGRCRNCVLVLGTRRATCRPRCPSTLERTWTSACVNGCATASYLRARISAKVRAQDSAVAWKPP